MSQPHEMDTRQRRAVGMLKSPSERQRRRVQLRGTMNRRSRLASLAAVFEDKLTAAEVLLTQKDSRRLSRGGTGAGAGAGGAPRRLKVALGGRGRDEVEHRRRGFLS